MEERTTVDGWLTSLAPAEVGLLLFTSVYYREAVRHMSDNDFQLLLCHS